MPHSQGVIRANSINLQTSGSRGLFLRHGFARPMSPSLAADFNPTKGNLVNVRSLKSKVQCLLLAAAALAGCQTCPAQSVSVSQVPNQLTSTPLSIADFIGVGKTNGWGVAFGDTLAYIEGTTNATQITIETGALIGQPPHATKDIYGGFINGYAPVGGSNSVFGAGIGLAYFNHNFYDATLNARLGDTYSLPVLKLPVYVYLESGGGYNIGENAAVAQAFTGFTVPITISTKWSASLGAALGKISDFQGNVIAAGGSVTYRF